ncbi:hypothetical protein O9993_05090 [Vibrio lentus]|nr:hypothetical protein [Vibrio lentus]
MDLTQATAFNVLVEYPGRSAAIRGYMDLGSLMAAVVAICSTRA